MATRQCTICGALKSSEEFRSNGKSGLRSECRECERAKKRVRRRRPEVRAKESRAYKEWNGAPHSPVTEKACSKCGIVKLACDFGPHKKTSSRLASWCKACVAEKIKRHRENPAVKEREAAYAKQPTRRARARAYQKTTAAKLTFKRYRQSPKGKVVAAAKKVRRRAWARQVVCTLTGDEWRQILAEHGHCCFYCQRPFTDVLKATMDHRIAISRGGHHTKENVIPACLHCNCSKRDKDWPVTPPE